MHHRNLCATPRDLQRHCRLKMRLPFKKKKKKSDDETPSRTVDRRLHRNTTAENKTHLYLRFTGSCSCNPAPEHDRTYYNSSETLSSVRNLNLWLAVASALFNRTVSQISQNDDCILRNPVQSDILKKTKKNKTGLYIRMQQFSKYVNPICNEKINFKC